MKTAYVLLTIGLSSFFIFNLTKIPEHYEFLVFEQVIDGDTFTTTSNHKIRLWCIDAPEKGEPYYRHASTYLSKILSNGNLKCTFIEKDRYQRDVMKCLVDNIDVGEQLVTEGLARDYSYYSDYYYKSFERQAKRNQKGIWIGKDFK